LKEGIMVNGATPSDLLELIEARLARADEHLEELNRDVASVLENHRAHVRLQLNADKTQALLYVVYGSPHPGGRWGAIIGDFTHCLRSALDNTVYAVAFSCAGGCVPPEHNRLCFPIADTNADWQKVKSRIRTLPSPVQTIIETVQPCYGGNPILSTLGHFNDVDKHRLPIIGIGAVGDATATCRNVSPGATMLFGIATGPVTDDQPLASVTFLGPQTAEPDMDFALALQIFVRDRTEWRTATKLMQEMRLETDSIISQLRPFIV
jgi:hypothetical protein